jgi:hypothetical protein
LIIKILLLLHSNCEYLNNKPNNFIQMKKQSLALITIMMTAGAAYSQNGIDKLAQEANRKALLEVKDKADASITKKDSLKAKTWVTRAIAYMDLANSGDVELTNKEPKAAFTAYQSLKKAVALDTKDGKEGAVAAEAKKYLTMTYNKEGKPEVEGQKLYAAFMNAGIVKYQAKEYDGALENLQMASEVGSKDTTAAMYTGVIAQLAKKQDIATAGFEKFIALGGKDAGIYYALIQQYKTEKNEEKAFAVINKALAANPDNKDLKAEKINLYLSFNKTDAAIAELESAVVKDPKNAQSVLNLGILYDNKGEKLNSDLRELREQASKSDLEGAKKKLDEQKDKVSAFDEEIKRLTAKLKTDPKSAAQTKNSIANTVKMRDEQKAVLATMTQDYAAKAANQGDVTALNAKIAELEAKQKEAKGLALANYKKCIEIDPNNYDVNYNLGVMNFNEAIALNKKVGDMNMETYKKEGKLAEELKDNKFKEALGYFEKAYSLKQEDDVKENLKNLYRMLKMDDKLKALGE